jgi:hypothetical protein
MNMSTTTHAFRLHSLNSMLLALALAPCALIAPASAEPGNDNRAPELGDCEELTVPAGNKVSRKLYAEGIQIYRWNGTSWIFVAPEANLYANSKNKGLVGAHYGGPTWESNSGSKVVATVLERCTPNTNAIPWLLLEAVSSEGPGTFDDVTFIQRVYTVGGLAPTVPGDFPGQEVQVPYTAQYYFYRAHN